MTRRPRTPRTARRLPFASATLAAAVLVLGLSLASFAQAEEAATEETTTEATTTDETAALERMAPGPEHAVLGEMVGDWTFTMTLYPGPDMEPMRSEGTFTGEWILGGRFVATHWRSEIFGEPFEGRSLEGYNRNSDTYESQWIDNQTTAMSHFTGRLDGDTIHYEGEIWDSFSGTLVRSRSISTVQDGSLHMISWGLNDDGTETKQMEIVGKRR